MRKKRLETIIEDLLKMNVELNGPGTNEDAWMRTIALMLEEVKEWRAVTQLDEADQLRTYREA